MKKRIICAGFAVLLSVLLFGCSDQKQSAVSDSASYDSRDYWLDGCHDIAAAESGYYFFDSYSQLHFFDRSSGETVAVCNKTNCSHKSGDASCDAWFDPLVYWTFAGVLTDGENLYVIGSETESDKDMYLFQVSPDGSVRKKLCKLFRDDTEDGEGIGIHMSFYQNALYYSLYQPSAENKDCVIYKAEAKAGAKPEEIYQFTGYHATCSVLRSNQGKLYFIKEYTADNEEMAGEIIQYDMAQKTAKTIVENAVFDYAVSEDTLYYGSADGIAAYSLETGEYKGILFQENEGEQYKLSYDGEYLYADNESGLFLSDGDMSKRCIYKLTPDGKKQGELHIGTDDEVLFGDTQNLFMKTYENDEEEWKTISKTDFGDDSLQWNSIYQTDGDSSSVSGSE